MLNKIIILTTMVSFLSCSNSTSNENEPVAEATNEKENVLNTPETPNDDEIKRGEEFSTDGAISTTQLAKMLETQDSAIVTLKGTVNAVCKKKGCWMTMPMNSETDMRVRFKDYAFFVPLNCENKTAYVKGIAKKSIISVDELRHYAEDNGDSKEEIAKITKPEVEYSFLASGVVLK